MCFPVYGNALHRGSRPALYDSVKYGEKYWTEFQAWSPDDSSRTLLASEVLRSLASLGMEMSFHGDHEEREPFPAARDGEDKLGLNQAEFIAPGEEDRAAFPFHAGTKVQHLAVQYEPWDIVGCHVVLITFDSA